MNTFLGTVSGAKVKGLSSLARLLGLRSLCAATARWHRTTIYLRRETKRSARNATGILRGGFAGEEEKKGEKPNVPRERERERRTSGARARDIIDDDDDIGNDFARRRGERRTDVVS